MAQPFDANARRLTGEPVPVAEQVASIFEAGRKGVFTVSTTGLLAYQTPGFTQNQKLTWY